MARSQLGIFLAVCVFLLNFEIFAWTQESAPAAAVPRLIKFSGTVRDAQGQPRTGIVGVTFALYSEAQGGPPLWMEVQNLQLNSNGRYTVLLGASKPEGVPLELFTANEARWLGVQPEGLPEHRVLLVSVPYALKAADAETLGGKPASSFVLAAAPTASDSNSTAQTGTNTTAAGTSGPSPATIGGGGTPNRVTKFDGTGDRVSACKRPLSSAGDQHRRADDGYGDQLHRPLHRLSRRGGHGDEQVRVGDGAQCGQRGHRYNSARFPVGGGG